MRPPAALAYECPRRRCQGREGAGRPPCAEVSRRSPCWNDSCPSPAALDSYPQPAAHNSPGRAFTPARAGCVLALTLEIASKRVNRWLLLGTVGARHCLALSPHPPCRARATQCVAPTRKGRSADCRLDLHPSPQSSAALIIDTRGRKFEFTGLMIGRSDGQFFLHDLVHSSRTKGRE